MARKGDPWPGGTGLTNQKNNHERWGMCGLLGTAPVLADRDRARQCGGHLQLSASHKGRQHLLKSNLSLPSLPTSHRYMVFLPVISVPDTLRSRESWLEPPAAVPSWNKCTPKM